MLRKLAAGTGAALVAAALAAAPALASRLPGPGESCGDVPASGQTGLDKLTTPADGSLVQPGDSIDVTLRWDDGLLDTAVLDRALDCVQVDGRPAPGLSLDQGQVPNKGQLTHHYRIPAHLAPGTEVCDQGFVFGPPADVPQRLSSNRVCFTVAPPPGGASTPPVSRPSPSSPGIPPSGPVPSAPCAPLPAPPGSSGPGSSGPGSDDVCGPGSGGPGGGPGGGGPSGGGPGGGGPVGGGPGGRGPAGDSSTIDTPPLSPPTIPAGPAPTTAPADFVGPAEAPRTANGSPETPPLPVTGPDAAPLAAAGGVNLVAAGFALIGGARRRRRHRL